VNQDTIDDTDDDDDDNTYFMEQAQHLLCQESINGRPQQEGDAVASLTYSTLKGGHFDGQIDIRVERAREDMLVIQVRLGIPKKGRKVWS
jgi:hypothetical protein